MFVDDIPEVNNKEFVHEHFCKNSVFRVAWGVESLHSFGGVLSVSRYAQMEPWQPRFVLLSCVSCP